MVFTAIAAAASALAAIGSAVAGVVGVTLGTTAAVIAGGAIVGAVVGGVVSAVKGESIIGGILKGGLIGAAVGGALGVANAWAAEQGLVGAEASASASASTIETPTGWAVGGAPTPGIEAPSLISTGSTVGETAIEVPSMLTESIITKGAEEGAKAGLFAGWKASDTIAAGSAGVQILGNVASQKVNEQMLEDAKKKLRATPGEAEAFREPFLEKFTGDEYEKIVSQFDGSAFNVPTTQFSTDSSYRTASAKSTNPTSTTGKPQASTQKSMLG